MAGSLPAALQPAGSADMRPPIIEPGTHHTANMDAKLDPGTGNYVLNESARSCTNELYIRLVTPLGSWWADPALGSRLHELQREKDLTRVHKLAVQYAEQALQPILDGGRAQSIAVSAGHPRRGWMRLEIAATDPGGDSVQMTHQVAVL